MGGRVRAKIIFAAVNEYRGIRLAGTIYVQAGSVEYTIENIHNNKAFRALVQKLNDEEEGTMQEIVNVKQQENLTEEQKWMQIKKIAHEYAAKEQYIDLYFLGDEMVADLESVGI